MRNIFETMNPEVFDHRANFCHLAEVEELSQNNIPFGNNSFSHTRLFVFFVYFVVKNPLTQASFNIRACSL